MRRQTVGFICSAIFGLLASSSHVVAQQKTVRACQEKWSHLGHAMFAVQDRASTYRLKAESCFSIACSTLDPATRARWLDEALRWFRLAEGISS
jgi:hypothetical protein